MSRARGRSARRRIQAVVQGEVVKAVGQALELSRSGPGHGTPRGAVSVVDAVQAMTTGATTITDGVIQPARNMERSPLDDLPFGPLAALLVQPLNPPRKDTGQPEPRVWEYPTGFNLPGGGDRLIDWQVLRRASVDVDVIRRCIEIRKEDVEQLRWSWKISEDAIAAEQRKNPGEAKEDIEERLRDKFTGEIDRLTKLWRNPWRTNGVRFRQWIKMVMEDHIVLDAVSIYPLTNLAGDVIGFRLIDGSTIKPLINADGERPQPPFPAFQQNLQGFPRGEYWADTVVDPSTGEDIVAPGLTAYQLTYWVENRRTNSPYGLSQVEQALIAASLYLKRLGWQHAEYDEGSTPDTWLVPPAEQFNKGYSPTQRREYEQALNNDLAGQTGKRQQVKLSYPGYQPVQMQTEAEKYKPDLDLHLVKMTITHLGVTPDRYGIIEDKGLGATGQHEAQADVQEDTGAGQDATMLADLINDLSTNYLSAPPELVFAFESAKTRDSADEDAVADAQIKRGSMTLNEDRRRLGRPAFTFPEADMSAFYGATGPMYLEGGLEHQQAMNGLAENPPAPGALGGSGGTPRPGGRSGGAGGAGGSKPKPSGPRPSGPAPRNKAAADAEVIAFGRWLRKQVGGDKFPARPFRFEHAEPSDLLSAGHHPSGKLMAFTGWEWREDITKDWRTWNASHPLHPRGPHGRFVKVGDLVGELERHHGELSEMHENAFDEAVRRAHAGRHVKRGESMLADDLERRGLLEEYGGPGGNKGKLEVSEAGRRHMDRRLSRADEAAAAATVPPEHTPAGVPEPLMTGHEAAMRSITHPSAPKLSEREQRLADMRRERDNLAAEGAPFHGSEGARNRYSELSREIERLSDPDEPLAQPRSVFESGALEISGESPGSDVATDLGDVTPDPEAVRATETPAERLARVQRGDFTPHERAEHERISTEAQAMLDRKAAREAARAERLAAIGRKPRGQTDATAEVPAAPVESPGHSPEIPGTVGPMTTPAPKLTTPQAQLLASALRHPQSGQIAGGNVKTLGILEGHGLIGRDDKGRRVITEAGRAHPAMADPAVLRHVREVLARDVQRSNDRMESRSATGALSNDDLMDSHAALLSALDDVDERLTRAEGVRSGRGATSPDTSMPQGTGVGAGTPGVALTPTRERTLAAIHERAQAGRHAVNAARQPGIDSKAIDYLIAQDLVRYVPGQEGKDTWERKIELTDAGIAALPRSTTDAAPAPKLTPAEATMLAAMRDGTKWANRPRTLGNLYDRGLIENDESGAPRLTDAGIAALPRSTTDVLFPDEAGKSNPLARLSDEERARVDATEIDLGEKEIAPASTRRARRTTAERYGKPVTDALFPPEQGGTPGLAKRPEGLTGLELADAARAAATREAAMDLGNHRGASETRSPETIEWDRQAMGRLWDGRHDVAARRALRERGETITNDSLRAEAARQESRAKDEALRNEVWESLHRNRRTDLPRSTDPGLTPAQREMLAEHEARQADADAVPDAPRVTGDTTAALVREQLNHLNTSEEAEAYLRRLNLTRAQLAEIVTMQGKKPGSLSKDKLVTLAVRGARMRGYRNAVDETMAQGAEADPIRQAMRGELPTGQEAALASLTDTAGTAAMSRTDQLRNALASASSRGAGHAAIAHLSAVDLKQLARELKIKDGGRKADVAERIVERTVGARLNSRAIRESSGAGDDLSRMSDRQVRDLHMELFPSGKAGRDQVETAPRAQLERTIRNARGDGAPAQPTDQIERLTADYDRLYAQAEALDTSINFAENDEERRALEFDREALDQRMQRLDRQIADERKARAKRRDKAAGSGEQGKE